MPFRNLFMGRRSCMLGEIYQHRELIKTQNDVNFMLNGVHAVQLEERDRTAVFW